MIKNMLLASFCFFSSYCVGGVINFDSLPVGSEIQSIATNRGQVEFSSNTGLSLITSSIFQTTSGMNYLGVDDGGSEVFFPGDVVTLNFEHSINYVSVDFISSPNTPEDIFLLDTKFGSTISPSLPNRILADSGEVFTVKFFSPESFHSVSLISFDTGGIYSYNIDTIKFSVPEPASLTLLALALLLLFGMKWDISSAVISTAKTRN